MATQVFLLSFTPKVEEDSHFDEYVSKGLVQPPTSDIAECRLKRKAGRLEVARYVAFLLSEKCLIQNMDALLSH